MELRGETEVTLLCSGCPPYIRILAAAAVRSSPERRCLAAGTSPLANISLGLTTFGFIGLFTYKYMYIYTYT